jgi:hypothetical protein
MIGLPGGVSDGGKNVIALQERIVLEDLLKRGSGAQELENVRDADALAADAWTTTALAFLDGDALKKVQIQADIKVPQRVVSGKPSSNLPISSLFSEVDDSMVMDASANQLELFPL